MKWGKPNFVATLYLTHSIIVPDRDIWSQLARPTSLLGFSLDIKSCVAMCIISVLFVLFLLVMCIWVDLQVIEDLGLRIYTQI